MKLQQLRVFLEIARTGGVRAAAEHLSLSQSAVTKTLAQLESEHGVLLFNRTGKGLLLTEAGEKFRPCAEAVLAGAERAERVLADYGAGRENTLRLAVAPSVPAAILAEALARFRARFPAVRVSFASGLFADASPLILNDKLDLALLIVSDITRGDVAKYTIENYFTIRYGVVMRRDHPLSGTASTDDLSSLPWLSTNSPSTTTREIETLSRLWNLTPPEDIVYCDEITFEGLLMTSDAVALSPLNLLEAPGIGERLTTVSDTLPTLPNLTGAFVCRRDAELTAPALFMKHAMKESIVSWTQAHPASALQPI